MSRTLARMHFFRIDPATGAQNISSSEGAQRLISQDGFLKTPQGIASDGGNVYVTDVATPDGNYVPLFRAADLIGSEAKEQQTE